jgi:lipopolysaccharide transport system permease protein
MRINSFLCGPIRSLQRHRNLTSALVYHDIASIYRGATLNLFWAFASPLVTLTVYSFVFGTILKSSFTQGGSGSGSLLFALGLFNGLIIWEFFSFVVSQSPLIVTSKPNYVKKIVFPLEILPVVPVGVGLFQFFLSLSILLVAIAFFATLSLWRALFIPFFLIPVVFYAAGLSWILASLGVFFRDVANAINPLMQLLWFGSGIFFQISSVPASYQWIFYANPVAACIDQSRLFAIFGSSPNLKLMSTHFVVGWFVACFGFFVFNRSKASFADVL